MKKLLRALVALVVLALGVVMVPSAQAEEPPSSYTPRNGALFNHPDGERGENCLHSKLYLFRVWEVQSTYR
jgi:hypothetical protein